MIHVLQSGTLKRRDIGLERAQQEARRFDREAKVVTVAQRDGGFECEQKCPASPLVARHESVLGHARQGADQDNAVHAVAARDFTLLSEDGTTPARRSRINAP
jgi:hypothetical protein